MSSIQQHLHSTQAGKTRDAFLGQRTMEKRISGNEHFNGDGSFNQDGNPHNSGTPKGNPNDRCAGIKTIYLHCKK